MSTWNRIWKKTTYILSSLLLLLAIWQGIILTGIYDRALLPSPLDTWKAVEELATSGVLFEHLGVSLLRFLVGYIIAAAAGIVLGILLGRLERVWQIIDPAIQLLRPVSPIAWSPFIVLWFGIGNMPAIVIIFLAAFFPVLLTTVSGVRKVSPVYLKVAQNLELGKSSLLFKVIVPAAFPAIASGLHLAVGSAWIFLVSGEMVGAQSGLGFLIVDSRNMIRLDLVLAGIVFIGLSGLLLDQCLRLLERVLGKKWGEQA